MSARAALTLAGLALAAALCGCARDPLETMKPREALEAGLAHWQGGRLPEAGRAFAAAMVKARRAELDDVTMRTFADHVFQFHASRADIVEAEKVYPLAQTFTAGMVINEKVANNMAVLYARAGRMAEAKDLLARTYYTLRQTHVSLERRPLRIAVLANVVHMERWANDEVWGHAAQRELLETLADLGRFYGGYHPLPPGVRALVERPTGWLREIGWPDEADALAARLAEIEARAPSQDGACVTYATEAPLGCVFVL